MNFVLNRIMASKSLTFTSGKTDALIMRQKRENNDVVFKTGIITEKGIT